MSRARRPKSERQAAACLRSLQHRQGQRLVAQTRAAEMRVPSFVDGSRKPFARNGRQGHIDRFRHLVQVEGELRPHLRDDASQQPSDPVEMPVLARGAVHPFEADALHQFVAACPDRSVVHEAHIRQHH